MSFLLTLSNSPNSDVIEYSYEVFDTAVLHLVEFESELDSSVLGVKDIPIVEFASEILEQKDFVVTPKTAVPSVSVSDVQEYDTILLTVSIDEEKEFVSLIRREFVAFATFNSAIQALLGYYSSINTAICAVSIDSEQGFSSYNGEIQPLTASEIYLSSFISQTIESMEVFSSAVNEPVVFEGLFSSNIASGIDTAEQFDSLIFGSEIENENDFSSTITPTIEIGLDIYSAIYEDASILVQMEVV